MARNLYKEVTDRILSQLAAGVVPWKQPWTGQGFGIMPRNGVTGRAYSGVNVLLLWARAQDSGYARPHWLTFKQALEAGGNVRKGEKGEKVVFVSAIERDDEATGRKVRIPFLKEFTVFNVAQCENLPEKLEPTFAAQHSDERDATIDEFLALTGADIRHNEQRAYWASKGDFINLPAFATFKSAGDYYATAFHELTHWTGAKGRLNRAAPKKMADQTYSFEELVAELGAAFLCAEFGISNNEGADAAYIAHWSRFLTDHETAIVSAASMASKAAEYLRELALANEQPFAIAAE
jgi:antirestriction protein ArdC